MPFDIRKIKLFKISKSKKKSQLALKDLRNCHPFRVNTMYPEVFSLDKLKDL